MVSGIPVAAGGVAIDAVADNAGVAGLTGALVLAGTRTARRPRPTCVASLATTLGFDVAAVRDPLDQLHDVGGQHARPRHDRWEKDREGLFRDEVAKRPGEQPLGQAAGSPQGCVGGPGGGCGQAAERDRRDGRHERGPRAGAHKAAHGGRSAACCDQVPPRLMPLIDKAKNLAKVTGPTLYCLQLYFNVAKKPLDNLKVRQAINIALDRQSFVKASLAGVGEPAYMNLPKSHWATRRVRADGRMARR